MDALGNPLRFLLTGGQVADCTQAEALMDGFDYQFALMDKAYDSNAILQKIERDGSIAVIPPKSNRLIQRDCDFSIYKERHKVENFFSFAKHYRRVFSRFDKYARHFLAFIHFVATLIWLR